MKKTRMFCRELWKSMEFINGMEPNSLMEGTKIFTVT